MGGAPKSRESTSTKEAVYLEGRKRSESWGDKKTGTKNYRDLVFADRIEFLDSRSNGIGESMPDESAEEHNTSSDDVPL